MEKPSRLLTPLLATVALASADNAKANGGSIAGDEVAGQLSDSAEFCEELKHADQLANNDTMRFYGGVEPLITYITRKINFVTDHDEIVDARCIYVTSQLPPKKDSPYKDSMFYYLDTPVPTHIKKLFYLDNASTVSLEVSQQIPGSESNFGVVYDDYRADGVVDEIYGIPNEVATDEIAINNNDYSDLSCLDNGQDMSGCEAFGIGQEYFDDILKQAREQLRTQRFILAEE